MPASQTYPAILHDRRLLEWTRDTPPQELEGDIEVLVTFRNTGQSNEKLRRERIESVLERLAARQTGLPVEAAAWEREIRADRPLAGREMP